MPDGTILVLLGFGLGALIAASQSGGRASRSPTGSTTLRESTIEAQEVSAIAAQRARELTALWHDQEARALHHETSTKQRG